MDVNIVKRKKKKGRLENLKDSFSVGVLKIYLPLLLFHGKVYSIFYFKNMEGDCHGS